MSQTDVVMGNVTPLKKRIEELEDDKKQLQIQLKSALQAYDKAKSYQTGTGDLRPRYDSYGQFDGYYP